MESDVFVVIYLLRKNEKASEPLQKANNCSYIIPPKVFQAGTWSKFSLS